MGTLRQKEKGYRAPADQSGDGKGDSFPVVPRGTLIGQLHPCIYKDHLQMSWTSLMFACSADNGPTSAASSCERCRQAEGTCLLEGSEPTQLRTGSLWGAAHRPLRPMYPCCAPDLLLPGSLGWLCEGYCLLVFEIDTDHVLMTTNIIPRSGNDPIVYT